MTSRTTACFAVAMLSISADAALAQQEVDFSKELGNAADGTIVIETNSKDQVLVFKGGTHYLGGRELIIRAPLIRIDETTTIQSFDPASTPKLIEGTPQKAGAGAAGGTWGCREEKFPLPPFKDLTFTVCNREGQIGKIGTEGAVGAVGASAKPITLTTTTISGPGKLVIIGNGQTGGQGQKGGQGGDGGPGANGTNRGGNVICSNAQSPLNGGDGGQGGTGGKGGTGGFGGAGAQITLPRTHADVISQHTALTASWIGSISTVQELSKVRIVVSAPGGSGGKGGVSGDAGPPGGGGDPGKGSHCGGGSDPGDQGRAGSPGGPGSVGPGGPKGTVTFN